MNHAKRQMLADHIHSYAFIVTNDAKRAAEVTDHMLAYLDRELEASGASSPRNAGRARSTLPATSSAEGRI